MIAVLTSPCSTCGNRQRSTGCTRCTEREVALAGSVEDRLRFEQAEAERLAQSNVRRLDMPNATLPLDVAIVGSGIPLNVALVSCGKAKLRTQEAVHAHALYVGCPFRLSFQYALATADDVQILSALHGLLSPYDRITPYELTMTQMTISEQCGWGRRVVHSLKALYPMMHLALTFYAGRQYIRPILAAVTDEDRQYWSFQDPLHGLGMFQRNAWLKKKLDALEDHIPF